MRILAIILFSGGIMSAISAAAKLPAAMPEASDPTFLDRFPDTLPAFTIAFLDGRRSRDLVERCLRATSQRPDRRE